MKIALLTLSIAVMASVGGAGVPGTASAAGNDLSHYGGDDTQGQAARRFCWVKEKLDFAAAPEDQAQADQLTACIDKRLRSTATCVLRSLPSKSIPGCNVIVGFSEGKQVGDYRVDGRLVGLTSACIVDTRYLPQVGTITPPDRVTVQGVTRKLAPDCKGSEVVN